MYLKRLENRVIRKDLVAEDAELLMARTIH
jgi:hypothetical protein